MLAITKQIYFENEKVLHLSSDLNFFYMKGPAAGPYVASGSFDL